MALRIITADQRLAAPPKVNIALFGPSGVGKTTQARTLDPETTLFLDLEAGTLAIQDWRGDVIDVRASATELGVHPWEFCRAMACYLGGPDPADADGPYSRSSYDVYCQAFGDPAAFDRYATVFVDSITVSGRMCFNWSQRQPDAFNKEGKADNRGAYGIHGREGLRWLTQLQHIKGRSVIVVGILDKIVDDMKRTTWEPQIDGSKIGRELPGIFDEVITIANLDAQDGKSYRAFVTNQDNPWGFPAKDRSGRLAPIEPPDLGALIRKIREGQRLDGTLVTSLPAPATAAPLAA